LYEAIHIVLGMPLYGLKVVSPGPVVIITAEDPADVLYARLREIMSGLGLSDAQKTEALAGIYIADLCGEDLRMVCRVDGTIKPTALADHIIERYGPINPAVITVDPTVSFGAEGQQYSNDDAQGLLTAARPREGDGQDSFYSTLFYGGCGALTSAKSTSVPAKL
jgi:regulatory protein RepA